MLLFKKIQKFFRKSSPTELPSTETILLERIYYIPPLINSTSFESFDSFDSFSYASSTDIEFSLSNLSTPVNPTVLDFLEMIKLAKELKYDISSLNLEQIQQNTLAISIMSDIFMQLEASYFQFSGKRDRIRKKHKFLRFFLK